MSVLSTERKLERKTCKQCGNPTKNIIYCSVDCRIAGSRRGKEIKCYNCEKVFYANARKLKGKSRYFCSLTCQLENRKTRLRRICEQCGEYYYLRYHRASKYCGQDCHKASIRKRKSFTCKQCGKVRSLPPSLHKGRQFCSTECHRKSTRHIKRCGYCGKRWWKKDGRRRKYCSQKCKRLKLYGEPRKCEWCGEEIKRRNNKLYCSPECAGMGRNYGEKGVSEVDFPRILAYASEPSDGDRGVWLPVSAREAEVTHYLFFVGMEPKDIIRNIKRWRKTRKRWERGRRIRP